MKKMMMLVTVIGLVLFIGCGDSSKKALEEAKAEMQMLKSELEGRIANLEMENKELKTENAILDEAVTKLTNENVSLRATARSASAPAQRQQQGGGGTCKYCGMTVRPVADMETFGMTTTLSTGKGFGTFCGSSPRQKHELR